MKLALITSAIVALCLLLFCIIVIICGNKGEKSTTRTILRNPEFIKEDAKQFIIYRGLSSAIETKEGDLLPTRKVLYEFEMFRLNELNQ